MTFAVLAGTLQKNQFAMLKGHPCRVTHTSTHKNGKHGHAKITCKGKDIFTGKRYEDQSQTRHTIQVPTVTVTPLYLMDIADDEGKYLSLLDEGTGDTRKDLKLPETELGARILTAHTAGLEVTVVVTEAVGQETISAFKAKKPVDTDDDDEAKAKGAENKAGQY